MCVSPNRLGWNPHLGGQVNSASQYSLLESSPNHQQPFRPINYGVLGQFTQHRFIPYQRKNVMLNTTSQYPISQVKPELMTLNNQCVPSTPTSIYMEHKPVCYRTFPIAKMTNTGAGGQIERRRASLVEPNSSLQTSTGTTPTIASNTLAYTKATSTTDGNMDGCGQYLNPCLVPIHSPYTSFGALPAVTCSGNPRAPSPAKLMRFDPAGNSTSTNVTLGTSRAILEQQQQQQQPCSILEPSSNYQIPSYRRQIQHNRTFCQASYVGKPLKRSRIQMSSGDSIPIASKRARIIPIDYHTSQLAALSPRQRAIARKLYAHDYCAFDQQIQQAVRQKLMSEQMKSTQRRQPEHPVSPMPIIKPRESRRGNYKHIANSLPASALRMTQVRSYADDLEFMESKEERDELQKEIVDVHYRRFIQE